MSHHHNHMGHQEIELLERIFESYICKSLDLVLDTKNRIKVTASMRTTNEEAQVLKNRL